jgi:hypothetical protein
MNAHKANKLSIVSTIKNHLTTRDSNIARRRRHFSFYFCTAHDKRPEALDRKSANLNRTSQVFTWDSSKLSDCFLLPGSWPVRPDWLGCVTRKCCKSIQKSSRTAAEQRGGSRSRSDRRSRTHRSGTISTRRCGRAAHGGAGQTPRRQEVDEQRRNRSEEHGRVARPKKKPKPWALIPC